MITRTVRIIALILAVPLIMSAHWILGIISLIIGLKFIVRRRMWWGGPWETL